MKILKNLLGENAKIEGSVIYLEHGSNDDGYWWKLPSGLQIIYNNNLELLQVSNSWLRRYVNSAKPFVRNKFVGFAIPTGGTNNMHNRGPIEVNIDSDRAIISVHVGTGASFTSNDTLPINLILIGQSG